MTTERKVFLFGGLATVVIIAGGIFFFSSQQKTETVKISKPFLGQEVKVLSSKHIPDGTKVQYNSNPPTSGAHYAQPQDAGIYDKAPDDGHLVHSLEHGAIILWYNPQSLSQKQITQLKTVFKSIGLQKMIMTPRTSMDNPIALTSWGRILQLKTIDEKKMKAFFDTNYDRAPEQAPI